jgi:hypothetical protein
MPEAAFPSKYRLTFEFIAAGYATPHEATAGRVGTPVATFVFDLTTFSLAM